MLASVADVLFSLVPMLVFYRLLAYIVYKKYVLELTPVQITRHADKTDIFQVCFGLLQHGLLFFTDSTNG